MSVPVLPDEVHQRAQELHSSLLGWVEGVPRHLLHRAVGQVKQTYGMLAQRYGPGYARAILVAGLAGLPIPLPGTSALTAAPVLAAAEIHRALANCGAVTTALGVAGHAVGQIESLGRHFLHELIHGFPRHAEKPSEFEVLVHRKESALGRSLTDAEHRDLLAEYLAEGELPKA